MTQIDADRHDFLYSLTGILAETTMKLMAVCMSYKQCFEPMNKSVRALTAWVSKSQFLSCRTDSLIKIWSVTCPECAAWWKPHCQVQSHVFQLISLSIILGSRNMYVKQGCQSFYINLVCGICDLYTVRCIRERVSVAQSKEVWLSCVCCSYNWC